MSLISAALAICSMVLSLDTDFSTSGLDNEAHPDNNTSARAIAIFILHSRKYASAQGTSRSNRQLWLHIRSTCRSFVQLL